jgi:hypothetical protein
MQSSRSTLYFCLSYKQYIGQKKKTDNTLVKQKIDNTLVKQKTDNTLVKQKTDNTLVKQKTDNTLAVLHWYLQTCRAS